MHSPARSLATNSQGLTPAPHTSLTTPPRHPSASGPVICLEAVDESCLPLACDVFDPHPGVALGVRTQSL